MNHRNFRKPFAIAVGAAIAGSLAAASVASASPFSLTSLGNAYMAATDASGGADKAKEEGKCGEGKCGADKAKDPERPVAFSAPRPRSPRVPRGAAGATS